MTDERKIRLLAWSDSPTAGTGLGVTSRHVLKALHDTGLYEIEQLAINYHGEFFDREDIPWQLSPAKLRDPNDLYGRKAFSELIATRQYDLVWISHDTDEVQPVVAQLQQLKEQLGSKFPKLVFYYPVDSQLHEEHAGMIRIADRAVTYSKHAMVETLRLDSTLASKLLSIPIGVDTSVFKALSAEERRLIRSEYFGVQDPETTVLINVNRNSVRKQLAHSILCFHSFHRQVPNSKLYLHTTVSDRFSRINLRPALRDVDLEKGEIIFPKGFSQARPLPVEQLAKIVAASDLFFSTSLGEGWGMTHIEAMACGVPVVCPDNTAFSEQLVEGRGYLYPCDDLLYVDNAGFRPRGSVGSVMASLGEAYKDICESRVSGRLPPTVNPALEYVRSIDWQSVTSSWKKLFEELMSPSSD